MMTWPMVRLSDFGTVVTGKTPSYKHPEHFGGLYPFITPTDMTGGRTVQAARRISEEGANHFRRQMLPPNSVCFVCIGATIGKICLTSEPSLSNQQINSIVVDTSRHDSLFVYYLLSTYSEEVKGIAGGAATPIVNKTVFEGIEAHAPPLPIQNKIAAILSAYDDLIENNLRRIAILEDMAGLVNREWFVHFRFPGYESVRMVDSPLGELPEGWEVSPLLDVADVYYGFAFKSRRFNTNGVGTRVVRIRDIPFGETATYTDELAEQRYFVSNGDIVVGMDGDFHMACWSGGEAYQNQRVARFVSKGALGNCHLFQALREPIQALNATITGTTVAHLLHSHIQAVKLVVPDAVTLTHARTALEPLADMQLNLKLRNRRLRLNRDLLLPRLVTGELDVSKLDVAGVGT